MSRALRLAVDRQERKRQKDDVAVGRCEQQTRVVEWRSGAGKYPTQTGSAMTWGQARCEYFGRGAAVFPFCLWNAICDDNNDAVFCARRSNTMRGCELGGRAGGRSESSYWEVALQRRCLPCSPLETLSPATRR